MGSMKEKRKPYAFNRDKAGGKKPTLITSWNDTGIHFLPLVISLSIAAILLVVTWVFALPEAVNLILEIVAFLVAGFGVFKRAVFCVLNKDFFSENLLMTVAGICEMCIRDRFYAARNTHVM